jgi:hypothetical protein
MSRTATAALTLLPAALFTVPLLLLPPPPPPAATKKKCEEPGTDAARALLSARFPSPLQG